MENFINSLPKPVLAFLAIVVGIIVVMLINPPHTVCDTQKETLRELQAGNIFPTEVKKNKIPPAITRAKEACQLGNSAGSCYEYFLVLKKVADDVGKVSAQCVREMFGVAEVKSAMNDGLEMMVRLAWGVKPPEPGVERFGWMQEAEISIFCRLKNIYIRANGEEAWTNLRRTLSAKLPGEEPVPSTDPSQVSVEPRGAHLTLSEQDIWNRSLFSVRCENF
ncbi:MAG: hypothetical protein AAGB31_08290 [Bdellovibrio sp.]